MNDNYRETKNLKRRGSFNARYSNINWFDWVADHAEFVNGHVLDVGCGTGIFWQVVGSRWTVENLTLLDSSRTMVEDAENRLSAKLKVTPVVGDASALPFDDASFDTVICMHMLYHVEDAAAALADIRRVLKPGGRAVITTVGDQDLEEINQISRRIFGSAGSDQVQKAFGTTPAQAMIDDTFKEITRHDLADEFIVDDADVVTGYITSFPPGNVATKASVSAFRDEISSIMNANGGALRTTRNQCLFNVRKEV